LRRLLASALLVAALAGASSAAAGLQPIRRHVGEVELPLLRAGVVHVPAAHKRGRITVIVGLRLPPLAAATVDRRIQANGGIRRLDVRSAFSRAYLLRVDAAQRAAIAQLRRAIPSAQVGRRFRIVLDGVTVTLPNTRLPALVRLSRIAKVYPITRFTMELNRSPSVIGDDVLRTQTGDRGDGIKIGVVDDGIDQTNPFFNPSGYAYPAGFPKGDTAFTTPKVIVARSFPGPGAGAAGRLPVDRQASFHGTHVAGIAAGDEGTSAPPGPDHPFVPGLSGVAPRAYLGNYRVFTVPTPIGHVANTPEIIAAFESAVTDGMQVINFSGGGPESEPVNDPMIDTVRNTAAAGVVPVIAAGNDRDQFGLGSVGSPGTAPAGIAVAAVSNSHVFAPALTVVEPGAPDLLKQIPVANGGGERTPINWASDQILVDVGTIVGLDGTPIERQLCGPPSAPNDEQRSQLPPHSLDGAIALVQRGSCTFISKVARAKAAGAIGVVLIDNRPGEANPVPIPVPLPIVTIADLDGAQLRAFMNTHGGRVGIRVGRDPLELQTGRSGVMTSFSSAGPTDFGHLLKPDVSAPGGQILSSTLPEFAGSQFAVFDGTSMATPHVTGAVALMLKRHPTWSSDQVKSALVSTAGAAYADTARTKEAPVLLEGGGLVNVARADDPLVFALPTSLSYGRLNVNQGAQSRAILIRVSDAGGGAGTWQAEVAPQVATAGATIGVPSPVTLVPGGTGEVAVRVSAPANAEPGLNYGFVVLHRGEDRRRIPYEFEVDRPALESVAPIELKREQIGTTQLPSRVHAYCCPNSPFGPSPTYFGDPQSEDGGETLYVTHLNAPAANLGAVVVVTTTGAIVDPFFLGSPNENDVQGYAGLPTNINALTFGFGIDEGAAGASMPREQSFYVSVDSPRDPFTGALFTGRYLLRSWVNDVRPPKAKLLTTRVARGRPTLVARITDAGSGVDPFSLAINYNKVLLGAAAYDPFSGLAVFVMPTAAPKLTAKVTKGTLISGDFQETKNVNVTGDNIMPNTSFLPIRIRVVTGSAVTWIVPNANACVTRPARLAVAASSTRGISAVRFFDGKKRIGTVTKGVSGLYAIDWKTQKAKRGRHVLRAVVLSGGRPVSAQRPVRVCR
jgi:minor extracellular serine protease Vpr